MHAGADPNTGRTRVSTPVLRNHANRWDTAGQQLSSEADLVAGLSVDGVAAGPFAGFAPSYDGLVDQFRARLHQGAQAAAQIADTLIGVANEYDSHDTEHRQTLHHLDEG